jgi:predicted RNA methylase
VRSATQKRETPKRNGRKSSPHAQNAHNAQTADEALRVDWISLPDLLSRLEPENPRKHDLPRLKESIRANGFVAPPLLNEKTGRLVFGHGRALALQSLHREDPEKPPARIRVDAKGWLVPVLRGLSFQTDEDALRYLLADNRVAEFSTWELPDLSAMLARLQASERLVGTGWTEVEFQRLIRQVVGAQPVVEVDTPAPPRDPVTKLGDVWTLGEHRLVCGDCTVERDLGRFEFGAMITDPPYGIEMEGVHNDDAAGLPDLFARCLRAAPLRDAVLIAFQSPRLFPIWLDALAKTSIKFERALWWYETGGSQYPWRGWYMHGEIVIVASRGSPDWPTEFPFAPDTYRHDFSTGHGDTTLGDDSVHATVKPIAIVADLVRHTMGDVYEPFAGSGSTLIACEQLGRRCAAIEIDPRYVDVAIERWSKLTGGQATRG